jgi:hypothetical protein
VTETQVERLWHGLAVAGGDIAVEEPAHSPYMLGSGPLPDVPAALGIEDPCRFTDFQARPVGSSS